jgi:hypothetical protein
VAKARKDKETERRQKKVVRQPGDEDEDDEDDNGDKETRRWPGNSVAPPFHGEGEAIDSIPTFDWDDLEQEEEEVDAP